MYLLIWNRGVIENAIRWLGTSDDGFQALFNGKDLTGWVVQLLEDDDPKEVTAKIVEVAKAFNESPKGQRVPVESFGDAVQSISGKLFKESDLWIKTREPVRIIPVKNSIGRRRRD